ncbi:MAG: Flagellar hook capping protein [Desulfotomaculum sp. 46_296]|nr:MAG: Flagellar hook capping protein [Desulfotomaculum sp. 46_296]HAU32312.1 flagellar hook capping protein [Desulfotomaculum sp.]
MQVSSVSVENNQQAQGSQSNTSILDKDSFLKLMVTQLVNQDPFNTQDSGAFLAQLAQVTQLEQMVNLNDKINSLVQSQVYTQAVSLVGRQVKVQNANGEEVEGTVSKVTFQNDEASIVIDEAVYSLSDVVEVTK